MVFSWNASYDNRLGTDKTTLHAFGEVYERLFKELHQADIPGSILEIGVLSGASVVNLSQAFPDRAVYGLDIDLSAVIYGADETADATRNETADTTRNESAIHYIQMDATDPRHSHRVPLEERFALMIDDGSHRAEDILAAFVLWGHRLENGGFYVIEDITKDILPLLMAILTPLGKKLNIQWEILDLRHVKNRWDDIVMVGKRDEKRAELLSTS
jgi:hypothetical protein